MMGKNIQLWSFLFVLTHFYNDYVRRSTLYWHDTPQTYCQTILSMLKMVFFVRLQNEILCIFSAQGAVKLPAVEVEDP